jgi:starch synthase
MGKERPEKKTELKHSKSAGKSIKQSRRKTGTGTRARVKDIQADRKMKVLFAASEVFPLVKTGGLADVACYLPLALHERGSDIRIVLPAYRSVLDQVHKIKVVAEFHVPYTQGKTKLLQTTLPDSDMVVYLIDAPELFNRPGGPYQGPDSKDWPDNAGRFALFGRVIRQISLNQAGLNWTPDILHCNDWHTGLAPALLAQDPERPAILFSIHSLFYQGLFPHKTYTSLELPPGLWSPDALEFYGDLSFIKGGLVYADRLIAVSPGYAKEITTPEYGCGLEGLLQYRSDCLSGILNGVDYRFWDPRHDPLIEQHFWLKNLAAKKVNKQSLQQELGLPNNDKAVMLAYIGRLIDQKGIDLILAGLSGLLHGENSQLVVLGAGDAGYEQSLRTAANRYAGQLAVHIGYNETLAHRIVAGADILLMPSRFEPCGLTQLYSLRYGTIPVVRSTGGLADTVVDATDTSLRDHTATGFQFVNATRADFLTAIDRAVTLFTSSKAQWRWLMRTAMKQEFSWASSARQYEIVYTEVQNARSA